MIIYFTFSTFLAILFSFSMFTHNEKYKQYSNILFFLSLLIFAGFRLNIGHDYDGYETTYIKGIAKFQEVFQGKNHYEYGFALFHNLFSYLNVNFNFFLFISSLLSLTFKFLFTFKLNRLSLIPMYFYLAYFILDFEMGILRQSIALGIGLLGYSYYVEGKKITSMLTLFISILFHKSLIMFLLLPFISKNRMKSKEFLIITIISLLFWGININEIINETLTFSKTILGKGLFLDLDVYNYSKYSYKIYFKLGFLAILLFSCIGFLYGRKLNSDSYHKYFRIFMLGGVLGTFLFSSFAILTRVSLNFYIFFGLCIHEIFMTNKKSRVLIIISLILFFQIKMYKNLYQAPKIYFPYQNYIFH